MSTQCTLSMGFGIHPTALVDDDRDLLWLALLARHTGVPVLNCSDGDGYSEREHSSNEVTQYVHVRDEGRMVVAVPRYPCTGTQSSNLSSSALQPLRSPSTPLPICTSQILAIIPWRVLHLHLICTPLCAENQTNPSAVQFTST